MFKLQYLFLFNVLFSLTKIVFVCCRILLINESIAHQVSTHAAIYIHNVSLTL